MSSQGVPLLTYTMQDLELELELLERKRELIILQNKMLDCRPPAERRSNGQQPQMFNDQFNERQRHSFSQLYDAAPRPVQPFAPKRRAEPAWAGSAGDRFDTSLAPNKRPRQGSFPQRYTEPKSSQAFQRPRANRDPRPSLLGSPKPLVSFTRGPPVQRSTTNPRPPLLGSPKPLINLTRGPPVQRSTTNPRPPLLGSPKPLINLTRGPPVQWPTTNPRQSLLGSPKPLINLTRGPPVQRPTTNPLPSLLGSPKPLINLTCGPPVPRPTSNSLPSLLDIPIPFMTRKPLMNPKSNIPARRPRANPQSLGTPKPKPLMNFTRGPRAQKQAGKLALKLLEEGDPEKYFKKNINKLLDVKLNEMFKKIEKLYAEENSTTASEILENLPEVKKDPKGEPIISGDDQEKTESNGETQSSSKEEEYDKLMSLLIERNLPRLLANHKDNIIKVLDIDQMFSTTKAAIIVNTNNKALNSIMGQKERGSIDATPSKNDPKLGSLPYFAKVISDPAMKKRKVMQHFLNHFNPKTIKRYKQNYDVFIVGLAKKEDFDKILAADQTQIGNATLTIVGIASGACNDSVNEVGDQNGSDAFIDQVITPQLDDQINELLSSIRKDDEEARTKSDSASDEKVVIVQEDENGKAEAKTDATSADADDSYVVEIQDDRKIVTAEDDEVLERDGDKAKEVCTPIKGRAAETPSTIIGTKPTSRLHHKYLEFLKRLRDPVS